MTANNCSRINRMTRITPTAKKPGTSRIDCSHPISRPLNPASCTTKLFNNAIHVENAIGMQNAIRASKVNGRRQKGRWPALLIRIELDCMARPNGKYLTGTSAILYQSTSLDHFVTLDTAAGNHQNSPPQVPYK